MGLVRILGGLIVDPANDVEAVGDLWLDDETGRVVAPPDDPEVRPTRTIDATGDVVFPAGVDVHCHIAGPKVNAARVVAPEERQPHRPPGASRSGTTGSVPSSYTTGYLYAGLGYTTAVDAAIPPLFARQVHAEFRDIPVLDKGFLTLVGNDPFVLEAVRDADAARLDAYLAWLVGRVGAYGVKMVNPGGVEQWKLGGRPRIAALDDRVDGYDVTPRMLLRGVAAAAERIGLPHPVHVHTLNLGHPGNAATTRETIAALDGHRAHLAHIQFHSYGGDADDPASFRSGVRELVAAFEANPKLTADVGNVAFGPTCAITGDGPLGYHLRNVTGGRRWISNDTECSAGCGVMPIEYKDKNLIHAIQWAVGLEWYLMVSDPWRLALGTDHPNGGSFLAYPETIALLMDRGFRQEQLERLPARVAKRTDLHALDREYGLREIAIITRAAPARMLGLSAKGHLGVGADADVTIYRPDADKRRMFALPRWVLKAGRVIVDDGEVRAEPDGSTWHNAPAYDRDREASFRDWFERRTTVAYESVGFAHETAPLRSPGERHETP